MSDKAIFRRASFKLKRIKKKSPATYKKKESQIKKDLRKRLGRF